MPPPRGRLFQETLVQEPFWMIVACQLVNLTAWEKAESVFLEVRRLYPTHERLALARVPDLEELLRPLGLWRRRAIMLPRFADAWLRGAPGSYDDVLRMPGCGKYAADSWAIFVDGRTDVEPRDGKLNWYLDTKGRQTHE